MVDTDYTNVIDDAVDIHDVEGIDDIDHSGGIDDIHDAK